MSSLDGPLARQGHFVVVALEGLTEEALTVQLQLLPASPHVLVLPRVEAYFPDDEDEDEDHQGAAPFDARRYIARVHVAASARRAVALDFLSAVPGPSSTPKTVLLQGGTAASQALCIEAIRQHDPTVGGDLAQAARLFDELVAGGRQEEARPACILHTAEDPITRAMRAADALDRATEALQPSAHILDLTSRRRRSSISSSGSSSSSSSTTTTTTITSAHPRPRARSLDLPIHGAVDVRLDALAAHQEQQKQRALAVSPVASARRGRPRTRPAPARSLGLTFLLAASCEASVVSTAGESEKTTTKPKLSLETASARRPPRVQYTDRGTDTDAPRPERNGSAARAAPPSPPLVEDLVICFVPDDDGQTSDDAAALALALQRCQRAGCGRQAKTQTRRQQQAASTGSTAVSALPETPTSGHGDNAAAAAAAATDYDPFAPHQYNPVAPCPKPRAATPVSSSKPARRQPPTPAHTPPPPPVDSEDREDREDSQQPLFRTIAVAEHPTAMDLHNALRACLHRCLQDTATTPGLWATPLLGGQPPATVRGVDLVLVLADDPVPAPPRLAALVRRRLDALGAAPHPATGRPCNGRLDLRYLAAQADLAWAGQCARSRATRAQDPSPSPSPRVHAARLLAQLDLYRRASPAVRFVQLECPAALLGAAAALQQLAGDGVVQVAAAAAAPSTDAEVQVFVEAVRRRLAAAAAGSTTEAAYYYHHPSSSPEAVAVAVATGTTTASRASATGATTTGATTTGATATGAKTTGATAAPPAPPPVRPLATDRARSPAASRRLVAKTIQVTATQRQRQAKAVVDDDEKKTAFAESDEDLWERQGTDDVDNDDDDADDDNLDVDDLDDVDIRRLMPLYLRDRAALLAAKDAAGATRSWGNKGPAVSTVASAVAAPSSPSERTGTARPGRPQNQQKGSSGSMRSSNNGQKARRWLGLA